MDRIIRKLQLSCDVFWGYNIDVDLTNPGFTCERDLVNYILNNLRDHLIKNNLDVLREKLDERYNNYHIHEADYGNYNNNRNFMNNLKGSPLGTIIYVCNH